MCIILQAEVILSRDHTAQFAQKNFLGVPAAANTTLCPSVPASTFLLRFISLFFGLSELNYPLLQLLWLILDFRSLWTTIVMVKLWEWCTHKISSHIAVYEYSLSSALPSSCFPIRKDYWSWSLQQLRELKRWKSRWYAYNMWNSTTAHT